MDKLNTFITNSKWLSETFHIFTSSQTWGDTILGGIAISFILGIIAIIPGLVKRFYNSVRQSQDQKLFCTAYQDYLNKLNEATNWDEKYFTPLDAEIESDHKGKRKRYYKNLLTCLEKDRKKKKVFLLLGMPGSGKSVSLRKLCRELLRDTSKSGQIPLYINLKEWDKPFTLQNPPTEKDLIAFILEQVQATGKPDICNYLTEETIEQLRKKKKLYFVFDSFDELPCLLGKGQQDGVTNREELISNISSLLCGFLKTTAGTGGIIASRLHNAPSQMNADITLVIQEFTDVKIKQTLEKYQEFTPELKQELFEKRGDLVSLCRNPMYLHLTTRYLNNNVGKLPANQEELYTSFVNSQLNTAFSNVKKARRALCLLACEMDKEKIIPFSQDRDKARCFGLEYPTKRIFSVWEKELRWTKDECETAINKLGNTRLCRRSQNSESGKDVLTFVHRRFQEYFLVESWMQAKQKPEYQQSILSENGHRDALVLYCEIAEPAIAQEIASFCWDSINERAQSMDILCKDTSIPSNLELIHLLIFMRDAFCHRKDALPAAFDDEFFSLCKIVFLVQNSDYFIRLALIHASILLPQERSQYHTSLVLNQHTRQFNDIILKNYRYLGKPDYDIANRLIGYFSTMSRRQFEKSFKNVQFCFSAKEFRYLKIRHFLLAIERKLLFWGLWPCAFGFFILFEDLFGISVSTQYGTVIATLSGALLFVFLLRALLMLLMLRTQDWTFGVWAILSWSLLTFSTLSKDSSSIFYLLMSGLFMLLSTPFYSSPLYFSLCCLFLLSSAEAGFMTNILQWYWILLFVVSITDCHYILFSTEKKALINLFSPIRKFLSVASKMSVASKKIRSLGFFGLFHLLVAKLRAKMIERREVWREIGFFSKFFWISYCILCAGILMSALIHWEFGFDFFFVLLVLDEFSFVLSGTTHDFLLLRKSKLPLFRISQSRMDRTQLGEFLSRSREKTVQKWYINRLITYGVVLTGEWNENERPVLSSAEANELLCRLDCPDFQNF